MPIKKITRYANEDGFVFNHEPIEETLSIREKPDGYEARYLVIDEDPISPADINDAGLFLVAYHRQCTIKSHYISDRSFGDNKPKITQSLSGRCFSGLFAVRPHRCSRCARTLIGLQPGSYWASQCDVQGFWSLSS